MADGTQELANDHTQAMRHSFYLQTTGTGTKQEKNPHHVFYSDEVLYELPEYDSENPDNSKVTFSAVWEIELLDSSSADAVVTFGQEDGNGYMSVKIITEGIRE